MQAWYPMTVATSSRVYKQIIQHYSDLTSDNHDIIEYLVCAVQ